jgi:hypothetical protein
MIAAVLLLVTGGACDCDCEEPTEEERLREMVDTTSVHLYVAMKVAVTKTGADPETRRARERLLETLIAMRRLAESRSDEDTDESVEEAVSRTLGTAGDAVALARAMYELRGEGAEIVRTRNEDALSPLLPIVLAERAPHLLPYWDMNTEHAVLLLALFTLKFHEKSPAPIPAEVLLYEAWMTDAGTMRLPGLVPPVRAVKAHLYAQVELCDLANAESNALAEGDRETRRDDIRATLETLGATPDDEGVRALAAGSRALAHGSTALCYMDRGEDEKGREELQRFVDAAEEFGTLPEDTALLRAYLAYHQGDIPATRRYLEQGKQSQLLDERDRQDVDELIVYLRDGGDRDALTDFYDRAFFTTFTVRLLFRQLERSGVTEDLEETPVYAGAYAWVVSAGRTIGTARDTIPSFSDATEKGKSFLESLFE